MPPRPVRQFPAVPPVGLSAAEELEWWRIHDSLTSTTNFLALFQPLGARPSLEAAAYEWNQQARPHEAVAHYRSLPDRCSRWRRRLAELEARAAAARARMAAVRARRGR